MAALIAHERGFVVTATRIIYIDIIGNVAARERERYRNDDRDRPLPFLVAAAGWRFGASRRGIKRDRDDRHRGLDFLDRASDQKFRCTRTCSSTVF